MLIIVFNFQGGRSSSGSAGWVVCSGEGLFNHDFKTHPYPSQEGNTKFILVPCALLCALFLVPCALFLVPCTLCLVACAFLIVPEPT